MKKMGVIYMWSDYFFYLIGLPEKERNAQIIILIVFWIIIFLIGILTEYIKKYLLKIKKKY